MKCNYIHWVAITLLLRAKVSLICRSKAAALESKSRANSCALVGIVTHNLCILTLNTTVLRQKYYKLRDFITILRVPFAKKIISRYISVISWVSPMSRKIEETRQKFFGSVAIIFLVNIWSKKGKYFKISP